MGMAMMKALSVSIFLAVQCGLSAVVMAEPEQVFDYNDFAADEMPVELLEEDWDPIPRDMGATSFAQMGMEVQAGEKQELECNCEKMKCNCLKKCECAVPAKR